MTDLILPLKREYFEQIRDGVKTEDYEQALSEVRFRLPRLRVFMQLRVGTNQRSGRAHLITG
ncbi:hypothetical protein [Corticimicrobacter populi]|uniref:hypothetical protein n=1 Tax=Corticimicrobacter populi TaxID=2175229 RepID=UPI0018757850|nr:hypothetical protein [Corticimicrobacter populi]